MDPTFGQCVTAFSTHHDLDTENVSGLSVMALMGDNDGYDVPKLAIK